MKIKKIRIYTGLLALLITGATLTGCHEKKSDLHGDQSEYQQPEHRAEIVNGISYDEFGNEIPLEEFEKKFHINYEKKSKTK